MAGETAVLSTHGDIADRGARCPDPGLSAKARHRLRLLKGEVWVVQSTGAALEIVDHLRQEPRR